MEKKLVGLTQKQIELVIETLKNDLYEKERNAESNQMGLRQDYVDSINELIIIFKGGLK